MGFQPLAVLVAVVVASASCSRQAGQVGDSTDASPSPDTRSSLPSDTPPIFINLDGRSGAADAMAATEAAICSAIRLTPQTIYPEVMIAQDISGSMAGDRWKNTKAALVDVANTLDTRFRLGLYFFPKLRASASNSCELENLPAGQYVDVAPALGNGTKIKTALDQLNASPPYGGTPTAEALPIVRDYLKSHSTSPAGTPKYVILSTDGSPNCTPPTGDGDSTNDPVSQAATSTAIKDLRDDGVITYVIGYAIDSNLQAVMNDWAATGGGSAKYINVTNQQSLSAALVSIANAIVSCEYKLDTTPTDPSYVRVEIDGKAVKLGDQNGWTLTGDRLILQGAACSLLRDGQQHDLNVQVECEPVIIP